MPSVSKILVYRIGQLGDMIVSLPAMWVIRSSFPISHLALFSDSHLNENYITAMDVFPRAGLFDQYIRYQSSEEGPKAVNLLKMINNLRLQKFDTLFYLAPRNRNGLRLYRDLIFFRLIGIKNILGVWKGQALPRRPIVKPLPHVENEADHLLARLRLFGLDTPASGLGSMDLKLTTDEKTQAERWLSNHCGNAFNNQKLIAVGPGSKWPSKVWPHESFAHLGRKLIAETGAFPVVFGGFEDKEIADNLISFWGVGASAAGKLSVRQAAAALSHCRLYVGNDTGTMHLAAAVGTRCVVAFSAQDWPGRWYPYGEGHHVIRKPVACEGCMLKTCNNNIKCLREISVAEMFNACSSILHEL